MKKNLLILLTLSLPLFFSCGKDETPPKTKTQLQTQGSWKFSSATANGADASNYLQACQKDNIYTFQAALTGSVDEGTSKCNASDPQTVPFTWNFASSETVLHVSTTLFQGTSNYMTIEALTETQLIVTFPFTPPIGPSVMIRAIFTH
jgi:hypothetical protein